MAKLYEITDSFRKLIREYYSEEDPSDSLRERIDSAQMDLDEKLANCCAYYKNLQAESALFEEESKRLKDRAVALSSRAMGVKEYVDYCLGNGGSSWSQGVHKISWRSSKSTEIVDEALIPEEFIKTKIERSVKKSEILKLLKDGQEVPGATLMVKNNIQIK